MKQQALPKQQGFLTSVDEQNKITVNKPEKWAKKSPLGSGQNNRGTTGFLHNRVSTDLHRDITFSRWI